MSKKALAVWIAVLCTVLVLAACSKNGANSSATGSGEIHETPGQSATNGASKDSEASESAVSGGGEAFTIRVGGWFLDDRPHEQAFMKAVEDGYKKLYPNAKIQWDITLGAAYFDKLKAQFASDSGPDLTFYQGSDYMKAGNFMELSNEPWVTRLSDAGKKEPSVTYQGKLYGVPMSGSPNGGVWYNSDLFNELGLTPPKTVQEFLDICEKIKAAGKTPVALGFKDSWTVHLFLASWIHSYAFPGDPEFGKKLYDGTIGFDDAAIQAVYKNFQAMKEKGYFNKNALSIDWPASAQLLASGEAAMIVQGPWMPGANKENIQNGGFQQFELGFFPLMDDKGQYGLTLNNGIGLAINAKTKLPEQAKALVEIMTNPDITKPWLKGDGALSFFMDTEVAYDDPAMGTLKAFTDKGALPYSFTNFIPASSLNAMIDVATKVVSGAAFDPADLKAASDAFQKDKATVVLPY